MNKRDSLKLLAGSLLSGAGIFSGCGGGASSSTSTSTSTTSDTTPTTPAAGSNTLWIPPLLNGTTAAGVTTYELTLSASSVQFQSGAKTATYGYNGNDFWGPTLLMKKGTQVRMRVKNSLPEDTTTHWRGMLVPGPVDGGPHQVVAAGATWLTDTFTVKNNAATGTGSSRSSVADIPRTGAAVIKSATVSVLPVQLCKCVRVLAERVRLLLSSI